MKRNAIIVLSLVLAAAIISGLVLYGQYGDKKDALSDSEKEISGLNEKIDQLDTDNSALNDQIRKKANLEKKLLKSESALKEELSSLQDQMAKGKSESEKKLRRLEGALEDEKKATKALKAQLSSKEALATELEEKFRNSQSHILSLQDEIAKT